ncbi:uncharacterized protein LOC113471712 [Diaphorina citri]|uniref:Uncharacterized protein LOC113471712 n=1 Tax=Diaphorina citri TaxID=121845 RepID=A0A3Q0JJC1_DIACI|nr:uncharacterized protein LOC113471712 [Diaphorina citri]
MRLVSTVASRRVEWLSCHRFAANYSRFGGLRLTTLRFENIHIATTPCLGECRTRTQGLILEQDVRPHHECMVSRTEKTEHAGDVVPGDPNTQWYSMPSPSRLSYILERFSDTNFSHIMHSALFVHPTVELSSRYDRAYSRLVIKSHACHSYGNFLASQIEEIHIEDMKKIMLSYCLPNQIQFNIVAWNEVRDYAESINIITSDRDANYVRDTTWQNLRSRLDSSAVCLLQICEQQS